MNKVINFIKVKWKVLSMIGTTIVLISSYLFYLNYNVLISSFENEANFMKSWIYPNQCLLVLRYETTSPQQLKSYTEVRMNCTSVLKSNQYGYDMTKYSFHDGSNSWVVTASTNSGETTWTLDSYSR
jgi:hypothetical protein